MHFSTTVLSVLALGANVAFAAPVAQLAERATYTVTDVDILNYALTLEYLERKFYMEGLAKFSRQDFINCGFPDPFYDNLQTIYYDEEVHVSTLAGALTAAGATPVQEAMYNFGLTDAKSFVGLSSVLEGVGVSAYLGAAASIATKAYLTVAGSILTVEARHSSYIRAALGEKPFPKPFDTPLDFNQVYSLAAQFITGFAGGKSGLPFMAFPKLMVAPSQYPYTAGHSSVTFTGAYQNAIDAKLITAGQCVYAVFYSGLDVYYVAAKVTGKDVSGYSP
jgi:hypothetical protein